MFFVFLLIYNVQINQLCIIIESSPCSFQGASYGIIEEQHQQGKYVNTSSISRYQYPCDESPYLPMQDLIRIQCQIIQQCRIDRIQQISTSITQNQIQRQIRYRISAKLLFHFVPKIHITPLKLFSTE